MFFVIKIALYLPKILNNFHQKKVCINTYFIKIKKVKKTIAN